MGPAPGHRPHRRATPAGAGEALTVEPEATAWLLNEAGQYLGQRADHQQARGLLERAVAIREASLGPDDRVTAHSLQGLAYVLRDQGDLRAARKLIERALAIDETHQGPDHLDTANSLHGLANVARSG